MNYVILDHKDQIAVSYDAKTNDFEIRNKILEDDVRSGIRVPYSIQMGNREVLNYPSADCDVALFARIYKEVIYGGELVKHGYVLKEDSPPLAAQKV